MNLVALCLAGYAAGLLLAQSVELPLLPLFLCCALLLILLLFQTPPRFAPLLIVVFCLLTGVLRYPVHLRDPVGPDLDVFLTQGLLRIEGRVLSTAERPEQGMAVDLEVLNLESGAVLVDPGVRLRLSIEHATQPLPVGSRIAFMSRVRRTRNFGIPGEFDYERHLAQRQIWYTAYLPDSEGLALYAGRLNHVAAHIDAIRQAGLALLDAALPPDDAMLLKGLLLGEKGAMPTTRRQILAAGGISHLFAISGLHLGLLAFFLYGFFRFIYSRSTGLLLWQPPARILWFLILPLLFFYLLLTGDALATQRAFSMLFVSSGLLFLRRRTDALTLLMTVAFIFLLVDPLALWQPSFLLSFSGLFGVLLWQERLQLLLGHWPGILRYPAQLLVISGAAFIATMPVVVLVFHLFAPAGLVTNLLAIPLVSFISLPAGLFGIMVSPFAPQFGAFILHGSAWVLNMVISLAAWTASLPGFLSRPVYLNLWDNLAILLVSLALLAGWRRRNFLWLLVPAVCLFAVPASAPGFPELTMFSVGQGESLLLRVDGKNILIDGGGLRSESFDVGERLLAPALGREGVRSLDAIILSHDHPDHSGGLDYLIANFEVHEFWSSHPFAALNPELRQALLAKNVVVHRYARPEWRPQPVAGLKALFMFTPPEMGEGKNNQSLCVYLATSAGGVLLTGDLEAEGVAALVQSAVPGPVDILKAPHHGSAGSDPAGLLAKLMPKAVLVSVGYQNPYHFPSRQLLDQSEELQIRTWRTDLDGTVRAKFVDGEWQISHWSTGLFH